MNKTGLIVGAALGGCHAIWSLLVWAGVAQTILDWIFRLHFLSDPFVVGPFSIGTAAGLVALTAAIGYGLGWLADVLFRSCRAPISEIRH